MHLPTVRGSSQAIYCLDRQGVPVAAEMIGVPPAEVTWKFKSRDVGALFLKHVLAVNDVRIGFELAAKVHPGHELALWESGNFITRWISGRLSEAQSAQEVRMIEGFADQWQAVQGYYNGVAGALEAAYRAQRAHGKLATADIENNAERQLAEMRSQSTVARQYFESFTLQAEALKEQLLEAEERQRAIKRSQKEQDLRLTRLEKKSALRLAQAEKETQLRVAQLDKEIRQTSEAPRPSERRRWDPHETADRIIAATKQLDRALRHTDQLFRHDPKLAEAVKQDIHERFRQEAREHMNGEHAQFEEGEDDFDLDGEGGDGDERINADVDPSDWQR